MEVPRKDEEDRAPAEPLPDPRQQPVTGAIDRMLDDEAHGRRLAEELAHLLGRG